MPLDGHPEACKKTRGEILNNSTIDINTLLTDNTCIADPLGFTSRELLALAPKLCGDISLDEQSELSSDIIRLGQNLAPKSQNLPTFSAAEAIANGYEMPNILIEDILYRGDIMSINGPSKAGKSFFLLNLALHMCHGKTWFDHDTKPSKILYLNFEIQKSQFLTRVERVALAINMKIPENFHVYSPRGQVGVATNDIIGPLVNTIRNEKIDAIFIDPIYKMYRLAGGVDENSNSDMSKLFDILDTICVETEVSIIYAHHYAKGSAGGKFAIDRSSGAGVFGRAPDAILAITELDTAGSMPAYRIEPILRNFCSTWSIDVRWDYPVHVIADDLSECNYKSKPGSKSNSIDIVSAWLECSDGSGNAKISDLKKFIGTGSYTTYHRAIKKLPENKFQLKFIHNHTILNGTKNTCFLSDDDIFGEIT